MDFKTPWSTIVMAANKTATINIFGYIGVPEFWQYDEEQAQNIVSTKEKMRLELEKIANLKADSIEINIDSFGGDVNHGLSIYNALAQNSATITVNYVGWSASIATVIAAAGDVVNAPNNFFGLLHEARGIQMGTKSEMETYSNFLTMVNNTASKIYAQKAGGEPESFLSVMGENGGEGEWRGAEELQALGLIDNVFKPMQAAASYDFKAISKEFGINTNTINMKLFKGKPLNSIAIGEVQAAYQGDLSAGIQFEGMNGVDIPDTTMELDGNTLVIEKSILKSITPIQSEMIDAATAATMVTDAIAPVAAELATANDLLVTMTAERDELQTKYDNLAKLSSNHKPKQKALGGNGMGKISLEAEIAGEVKAIKKQAVENVKSKRGGNS